VSGRELFGLADVEEVPAFAVRSAEQAPGLFGRDFADAREGFGDEVVQGLRHAAYSATMFATRAGWDLGPDEIAEAIACRRADGRPVLDLTDSNPTRCGLLAGAERLARSLARLASDPRCAVYAPDPRGDLAAREAIAAHHAAQGGAARAESVLVTAGTSEGYAHLFRLLADPGDRVLVPAPSYPLFGLLAGLEGVDAAAYPLRFGGGRWRIDLDAVRRAATPPARAVLLVHPNNPTGSLATRAEARALRALCRERGLALVSDEVFADHRSSSAPPDAPRTLLPSEDDAENGPLTFVLSGASKLLGLPQLKVGWIVAGGPAQLRDEALARLEVIADTYLSVSPLVQLAFADVFTSRAELAGEIAARIEANRRSVARAVAGAARVQLLEADGGWYAILRVVAGAGAAAPDEDALARTLRDGPGVFVQPGWLFDLEPRDEDGARAAHLVISLLPEPDVLDAGVGHVLEAIAAAAR